MGAHACRTKSVGCLVGSRCGGSPHDDRAFDADQDIFASRSLLTDLIVGGACVNRSRRCAVLEDQPNRPKAIEVPSPGRGAVGWARACRGTLLRNRAIDERKPGLTSWTPPQGAFDAAHTAVFAFESLVQQARRYAILSSGSGTLRNKAQTPMFAGTIEETRNGRC